MLLTLSTTGFVVYTLEKICATGQDKFVSIADVGGWGYSNCDIRGYLAALSILQVFSSHTHAF